MACHRLIAVILSLTCISTAQAAREALPEILTLEEALRLAEEGHPDLETAHSELDLARADQRLARAARGTHVYLELVPQLVTVSSRPEEGAIDDSLGRLVLSKPLFDFGRTRFRERAATLEVQAQEFALVDARARHRLEVMRSFFDVLLADQRYRVEDEIMTWRFLRYDRARERLDLGQVTEVDVIELESRYREALDLRAGVAAQQSSARARLARALNRPAELPGELERTELPGNARPAPDFHQAIDRALERSPALDAARRRVAAAQARVAAERAAGRPTVEAELAIADYARRIGSRSDRRATVNVRIPLRQGGAVAARVGRAAARLRTTKADLARAEHAVRQTVLDLVQRIETLVVQRRSAQVRLEYRDRYLDRARARYELELRTDFGDAQAQLTEAVWSAERTEYQLALAWAQLAALAGTDLAAAEPSD